jgi:hypothetical protein
VLNSPLPQGVTFGGPGSGPLEVKGLAFGINWPFDGDPLAHFYMRVSFCCVADFNGDGDVGTDTDIEAFFACLGGHCCAACAGADFNGDGEVGTDADIESFFRVLAGGSC